jgi:hypothetical protein
LSENLPGPGDRFYPFRYHVLARAGDVNEPREIKWWIFTSPLQIVWSRITYVAPWGGEGGEGEGENRHSSLKRRVVDGSLSPGLPRTAFHQAEIKAIL